MAKLSARGRTVEAKLCKEHSFTGWSGEPCKVKYVRAICSDRKILQKRQGDTWSTGYSIQGSVPEGMTIVNCIADHLNKGWQTV